MFQTSVEEMNPNRKVEAFFTDKTKEEWTKQLFFLVIS